MPRDDLSIDFVKSMPPSGEALEPAQVLDEWINRSANLPEEVKFMLDEIADKDRQYQECIRLIEERDGRIQKFIKTNGSHETNSREEAHRRVILENFEKAERLADEKIELATRMRATMDRHLRQLDIQLKHLYDRGETGFTDPDELPSLLRPSAANQTAPPVRSSITSSQVSSRPNAMGSNKASSPVSPAAASATNNNASTGNGRGSSHSQVRQTQTQQGHSASAPASPAASMILNRQTREGSAGPAVKRGPRGNTGHGATPTTSSGLARHSSLGPGTPKSHHQTALGNQRAGSAGPRAMTKNAGAGPGRKAATPSTTSALAAAAASVASTGPGRKKGSTSGSGPSLKTSLSRVKRPSKNSAASSTAESELSEAESASESNASSRRGTPARGSSHGGASGAGSNGGANGNSHGGNGEEESSSGPKVKREKDTSEGITAGAGTTGAGGGTSHGPRHHHHSAAHKHGPGRGVLPSSDDRMDLDDEEAGDDRKYCLCQNVSFGDMVACDNEDCPYEWFHWSCVGLKSEPNGTWYCPVCAKKMNGGDPDVEDRKPVVGSTSSRAGGSNASNHGVNSNAGSNSNATKGEGGSAAGGSAGNGDASAAGIPGAAAEGGSNTAGAAASATNLPTRKGK